ARGARAVPGAGGRGIAREEPRPEESGASARVAGGATLAAGRAMLWLGSALGLRGLAGMGARWVGRAVTLVPRLSESLLGAQEAALRELLREFREGDVESALRHALPLGDPGAGAG